MPQGCPHIFVDRTPTSDGWVEKCVTCGAITDSSRRQEAKKRGKRGNK